MRDNSYKEYIPFVCMFVFLIVFMSVFIPMLISNINNTVEINYDNLKVVDKGMVSHKRIDRGFGNLYLIEINNNSEYNLGLNAYYDISIKDYIIIYQFLSGLIYRIINKTQN